MLAAARAKLPGMRHTFKTLLITAAAAISMVGHAAARALMLKDGSGARVPSKRMLYKHRLRLQSPREDELKLMSRANADAYLAAKRSGQSPDPVDYRNPSWVMDWNRVYGADIKHRFSHEALAR